MAKKLVLPFLIALVTLIIGYLLGNFLPLSNFSKPYEETTDSATTETNQIPDGKGKLIVNVTNTDGEPVIGIEVDVAAQPGPPEEWGVKEADFNGNVEYVLDPGSYYVFFNMNRFPTEYEIQPEKQITITEGEKQEISFVLSRV